jgi:hypothetical protein
MAVRKLPEGTILIIDALSVDPGKDAAKPKRDTLIVRPQDVGIDEKTRSPVQAVKRWLEKHHGGSQLAWRVTAVNKVTEQRKRKDSSELISRTISTRLKDFTAREADKFYNETVQEARTRRSKRAAAIVKAGTKKTGARAKVEDNAVNQAEAIKVLDAAMAGYKPTRINI